MWLTEDEDNAKILRDLFEGTGIMSAIDHSKIESANDPETRAIDYEASRIARQAADALRQSRRVSFCCHLRFWRRELAERLRIELPGDS